MTVPAAPALWSDWCAVTGTDPASGDTEVLSRFARQAGVPQRVLNLLRARHQQPAVAPAWPDALDDSEALHPVLDRGAALAGRRDTGWIERRRLRRLLFAAVLLAPPGGLGPTRQAALDLTPAGLHAVRSRLGITVETTPCPNCAVWMWLHIVGTNNGWTHRSVRLLLHEPERLSSGGSGPRPRPARSEPGLADLSGSAAAHQQVGLPRSVRIPAPGVGVGADPGDHRSGDGAAAPPARAPARAPTVRATVLRRG